MDLRAGVSGATLATLDTLGPAADQVIDAWVQRAADFLYLPLLTVLTVVDPDAILVGGQLPARITEALCLHISKRLSMHVGIHWPDMAVRPAAVTQDVAAIGAAVLAFRDMWEAE